MGEKNQIDSRLDALDAPMGVITTASYAYQVLKIKIIL
jgi:hypothetical protein